MKRYITLIFLFLAFAGMAQEQKPTQTIRGTLVDQQSEAPLIGANIIVVGSDPFIGASTDIDGQFRLENVPVGRQTLRLTYLGYETREIPNVLVNSGKEMVLRLTLQESLETLAEVEITSEAQVGETMNKMATVSARTFSVEETKRFAGAIGDPSRMASSYAGVGVVDGDNDLVIRGNSPRGMLWRMEGVEIPNPNHFSNQGASGGPISMLNSNMMANSEFYTGAFPAEYGNAFSGVFDISLRKGNNEQREYSFQLGLLGTDASIEGPFSPNYNGSYLVNYRYSTLAMFNVIGLDIVGDIVPKFQDLSYNIDLPTQKYGNFSLFGLAGRSYVDDAWEEDSLHYTDLYQTDMYVSGIKHSYLIGDKTLIKSVGAVMGTRRTYLQDMHDSTDAFIRESYNHQMRDDAIRFTTSINHKFNARHTLKTGVIYNHLLFDYTSEYFNQELDKMVSEQDGDGDADRVQTFAQWQFRPGARWTINTGLHHTYFSLNDQHVVEPRLGAKFQVDERQSINAGLGVHSKTWDPSIYFSLVPQEDGSVTQPNKQLDMLQAYHAVLGYSRRFGNDINAKIEIYYQHLENAPIIDSDTSYISALNSQSGYPDVALANKGTGYNYGAELTIEKYFTNQYFFMVTSSLFDSKYKGGDGEWRNTRWNNNYVNNIQFGKEWDLGENKNKTLRLSLKGVWAGGVRYVPIDLEASRAAGEERLDHSKAFEAQMPDYLRFDTQIAYTINKKKTTHTIKLDIQNTTNHQNYWFEDYNAETGQIERSTQVGILPVLSYKIQF